MPPDCNGNQCLIVWYEFNWIELLLLKIRPNNGEDLWRIFIEMACDSDTANTKIDNEAVIVNGCDGHRFVNFAIMHGMYIVYATTTTTTMRASSRDFSIFILLFLLLSLEFEPCDPHNKLNKIYDDRNRLEEESHQVTTVLNTIKSYVCLFRCAHTENRPKHEALKSFLFFFFFSFNFGFEHFCHSQQDTHAHKSGKD